MYPGINDFIKIPYRMLQHFAHESDGFVYLGSFTSFKEKIFCYD